MRLIGKNFLKIEKSLSKNKWNIHSVKCPSAKWMLAISLTILNLDIFFLSDHYLHKIILYIIIHIYMHSHALKFDINNLLNFVFFLHLGRNFITLLSFLFFLIFFVFVFIDSYFFLPFATQLMSRFFFFNIFFCFLCLITTYILFYHPHQFSSTCGSKALPDLPRSSIYLFNNTSLNHKIMIKRCIFFFFFCYVFFFLD